MIPYRGLQKRRSFPLVTLSLILLNTLLFLYETTLSPKELLVLIETYGVVPKNLSRSPLEYFDLLTSLFLHGGWLHLIANMLYLWIFGNTVEEKIGRLDFLYFYLLSGIVATGAQVFAERGSMIPQIGASGSIAGILGLYLRLFPRTRIAVLMPVFIFLRRMILPAWIVLVSWFVLELAQGLLSLSHPEATEIAFFAHVGGFLFGLLLGPFFVKKRSV